MQIVKLNINEKAQIEFFGFKGTGVVSVRYEIDAGILYEAINQFSRNGSEIVQQETKTTVSYERNRSITD